MTYRLIYPETKWVDAAWMESQYSDAVANGKTEAGATYIDDKIAALEDLGYITVDWRATNRRNFPS